MNISSNLISNKKCCYQVQNFGEPFFLVVRENETLIEVKQRIQKKLMISDDEFLKVSSHCYFVQSMFNVADKEIWFLKICAFSCLVPCSCFWHVNMESLGGVFCPIQQCTYSISIL